MNSLENRVIKQIKKGMSTDSIVGMFLNKRTDNADDILKIIRNYKWNQFKKGKR